MLALPVRVDVNFSVSVGVMTEEPPLIYATAYSQLATLPVPRNTTVPLLVGGS